MCNLYSQTKSQDAIRHVFDDMLHEGEELMDSTGNLPSMPGTWPDYPAPIIRHGGDGSPSPAGDDLEDEIDPIAWVVRHPASTFWWRVEGYCLWDVGIRDGDIIAVDCAAMIWREAAYRDQR